MNQTYVVYSKKEFTGFLSEEGFSKFMSGKVTKLTPAFI
jgi:hypothetical protein